jgi:glutamate-1-semialdehyde 2,1-aminomutase
VDPAEFNTPDVCPVPDMGRTELVQLFETLFPGKEFAFLLFGWVFKHNDFDAHNEFIAQQVSDDPHSAALMLVHPSFSVEKVEADLDTYGFLGFKPYRLWADDEVNCRITDMLPEPLIELADSRELVIVMHLGKKLGIADEQNVEDLLRLAERYPRVRWDLAHMARSSVAWPLERSIERIREVPNFWYDISSVTHADCLTLAFRNLPLDRIMFGSDLPSDLRRGNMISFGLGWEQLGEEQIAALNIRHCDPRPTYTVYETIRALRRAAKFEDYGRQEIEDLFFNNASRFVYGEQPGGRNGRGAHTSPR